MKRRVPTLVLTVAVLACTVVFAQPGSQPPAAKSPSADCCHNVAVLDLVRIFNECAQITDLNQLIREKSEAFAKEAAQRKKVIEDKQMELQAFKTGSPDWEARRKDLVRLNIDANVWLKVTEQQVDQEKFDWTRIIYEQAVKVASDHAKERGYDAVLQKTEFKPLEIEPTVQNLRRVIQERAVVYNASDIDITELVIRKMDAEYKAAGGKKVLGSPPVP
ncbi:MAG TPA: OmpH family outer membrane protein [Phycisphaerae bacterium]|nr:OmpH family outer membrane protein [Phycisphaerae bacterium]